MNTTAGSSCPLLFSLQHTPNFFSAPPPLLSCLTCSSFCPLAEELVGEEGGDGERRWRWWRCWGPVAELCSKISEGAFRRGTAPRLLQMCSRHLRNLLFHPETCQSYHLSINPCAAPSFSCFNYSQLLFPLLLPLSVLPTSEKLYVSCDTKYTMLKQVK